MNGCWTGAGVGEILDLQYLGKLFFGVLYVSLQVRPTIHLSFSPSAHQSCQLIPPL